MVAGMVRQLLVMRMSMGIGMGLERIVVMRVQLTRMHSGRSD